MTTKRGDIKRFREHLNREGAIVGAWTNKRRGQKTRLYGDYLYAQDREMFMVHMAEWLRENAR